MRALGWIGWILVGAGCGGGIAKVGASDPGVASPGGEGNTSAGASSATTLGPGSFGGAAGTADAGAATSGQGAASAPGGGPGSGPSGVVSGQTAPSGPPPATQADVVRLAAGLTCPWTMAIDAAYVYWTECGDPTNGFVRKVPKGGGAVVTLASGDRLSGIAVDGTNVYWVAGTSDGSSGAIMKVPSGGGTATLLDSREGTPTHLAVDGSYAYWVEQMEGSIVRMPLSGGAPETVASVDLPWQFTLTDTDVYWLDNGLMKAPKAGGTPVALTPMDHQFFSLPTAGLAVDATTVYFTSGPPAGTSGVDAVPSGGGAVTLLAAGPQPSSGGPIAIDATRVYWADGSAVYAAPLAGGAVTTLAVGQQNVDAIAVDATRLYWLVNGDTGSLLMLPLAALDGG